MTLKEFREKTKNLNGNYELTRTNESDECDQMVKEIIIKNGVSLTDGFDDIIKNCINIF